MSNTTIVQYPTKLISKHIYTILLYVYNPHLVKSNPGDHAFKSNHPGMLLCHLPESVLIQKLNMSGLKYKRLSLKLDEKRVYSSETIPIWIVQMVVRVSEGFSSGLNFIII